MSKELIIMKYVMAGCFIFLAIAIFTGYFKAEEASGSAFTGSAAKQGFATTTIVGPQAVKATTIFNDNTGGCTARVITTGDGTGVGIKLLTGDPGNGDLSSTTLSGVNGIWQAGSTTVAYDSGIYGCGKWTARATASTTLTIVEYR